MRKRRVFSREFKKEAVRLLEEGKKSGSDLARELGIRRNQVYKWKETIDSHGKGAFPGSGRRATQEKQAEEIAQLKRQLRQVTEENDILKKAAAFFARELK